MVESFFQTITRGNSEN